MTPAWLNPAGGLRYHWRAYRHQNRLWRSFILDIDHWIRQWSPPESNLVVVGPSGGYCLPLDFLGRFKRLTLIEPDPTAYLIFKHRLQTLQTPPGELHWIRTHLFRTRVQDRVAFDPRPFLRFLDSQRDSAVLFANFLGQLGVLFPNLEINSALRQFGEQLSARTERSVLSFHDRYSGSLRPRGNLTVRQASPLSEQAVVASFYSSANTPRIELIDHETSGMFGALPASYFCWEITPGCFHLIEGIQWSGTCADVQNLDK